MSFQLGVGVNKVYGLYCKKDGKSVIKYKFGKLNMYVIIYRLTIK